MSPGAGLLEPCNPRAESGRAGQRASQGPSGAARSVTIRPPPTPPRAIGPGAGNMGCGAVRAMPSGSSGFPGDRGCRKVPRTLGGRGKGVCGLVPRLTSGWCVVRSRERSWGGAPQLHRGTPGAGKKRLGAPVPQHARSTRPNPPHSQRTRPGTSGQALDCPSLQSLWKKQLTSVFISFIS